MNLLKVLLGNMILDYQDVADFGVYSDEIRYDPSKKNNPTYDEVLSEIESYIVKNSVSHYSRKRIYVLDELHRGSLTEKDITSRIKDIIRLGALKNTHLMIRDEGLDCSGLNAMIFNVSDYEAVSSELSKNLTITYKIPNFENEFRDIIRIFLNNGWIAFV